MLVSLYVFCCCCCFLGFLAVHIPWSSSFTYDFICHMYVDVFQIFCFLQSYRYVSLLPQWFSSIAQIGLKHVTFLPLPPKN